MKAEISTWIWILGTTVMGMMIFTIGMTIAGSHIKDTQRYMAIQEFSNFLSKTKMVCQGGVENIYPHKATFPQDIKAIYSSEIKGPPPDKVSVYIRQENRSLGKYMCIQFFGSEPSCEPPESLPCKINMSYLGTPSLKEDLFSKINQILEKNEGYTYKLTIKKTAIDTVTIMSEQMISLNDE